MPRPEIMFFCELGPLALAELFAQPGLIDELQTYGYGVALGMLDFSPQRAAVVRQLNEHQICVVAWLLLPPEQGYWFNLRNYPQALARYQSFREWVEDEALQFDAIGLDIEPLLSERRDAHTHGPLHMFSRAAQAQSNALYPAAHAAYLDLTAYVRHDGYEVHTYQYPFIVDDRRSDTTLIQRMLDIVDVPADQEVLMLYSSHVEALLGTDLDGAFVRSYAKHADGIAVGVSGGGFMDPISGTVAPRLDWDAFRRDLILASQYTDTVHIFSLEGCVERGWLPRLRELDWDASVAVPRTRRLQMAILRAGLSAILWSSRHGWTALGWLGWLVAGGLLLSRRISGWSGRRRS